MPSNADFHDLLFLVKPTYIITFEDARHFNYRLNNEFVINQNFGDSQTLFSNAHSTIDFHSYEKYTVLTSEELRKRVSNDFNEFGDKLQVSYSIEGSTHIDILYSTDKVNRTETETKDETTDYSDVSNHIKFLVMILEKYHSYVHSEFPTSIDVRIKQRQIGGEYVAIINIEII